MTRWAGDGKTAPSVARGAVLVVAAVTAVVALAVVVPGPTAAESSAPSTNTSVFDLQPAVGQFSPDATAVRLTVREGGDAEWVVEYRYTLENASEEQIFNSTVLGNVTAGPFRQELKDRVVEPRDEETDRPMAIGTARAETEIDDSVASQNPQGVVRFRFNWTNFAESDGRRYVAGGTVVATNLASNQSLTVAWTEDFRVQSVAPEPTANLSNEVVWSGPTQFVPAPTVELLQVSGGGGGELPLVPLAAGVGLLVAVGGWVGLRRREDGDGAGAPAESEPESEPGSATPDEELLTDEERVLRLLEERGGRMKQQEVIDAVDWSRTKASDVVNEMNEAGQIEVYRLGRENVLALPGEIEV